MSSEGCVSYMFNFIINFYTRNKQNKFKYLLLRLSSTIIFVVITSKIANYVINDLLHKTPKPTLDKGEHPLNFIFYIFSEAGLIVSFFIILSLFLIDSVSHKKN